MRFSIGAFLQEIRKSKGLTQKELAEQIGVSDKTISKWENGNSVPDTSILLSLCNVLEITVNEFLSCERILPENYSMKAEENMMALIEENKRTKRNSTVTRIIGGIVVCITLIFIVISTAGMFPIGNFIDPISIMSVVLLEFGVILISKARTKEKILQLMNKTILPVGGLISIISVIIILLCVIDGDSMALRVNLAVAVLALLYSIIIKIVVEILLVRE